MLLPASTGFGVPDLLVMFRSACVKTLFVAIIELLAEFGSIVLGSLVPAVAVLVIVVPLAVLEATLTTTVKESISPLGTGDRAKTRVPVPPTTTASARAQ